MQSAKQAPYHVTSNLYRLDQQVVELDLRAQQTSCPASQRGAWRELQSLFEECIKRGCLQLFIEPDGAMWRLRHRYVDHTSEQIIEDPGTLSWATQTLLSHLLGEPEEKAASIPSEHRHARFCIKEEATTFDTPEHEVELHTFSTLKGKVLQFNFEQKKTMPSRLEELGFTFRQLALLRARLQKPHGYMLITGSEPRLLDDVLLALAQELIEPARQLLYLNHYHRYALPRVAQMTLPEEPSQHSCKELVRTLQLHHDTLLIHGAVPEALCSELAESAAHRALIIRSLQSKHAIDIKQVKQDQQSTQAQLNNKLDTIVNHFPLRKLCDHCKAPAAFSEEVDKWLNTIRTPATESVIDWLSEGNTDQFMAAQGCELCAQTGYHSNIGLFDIQQRQMDNIEIRQPPTPASHSKQLQANNSLIKRLMALVYEGVIPPDEAMRVALLS